jgi:hypothetical protein
MPKTETPRYKYKPPKAEMRAIDPSKRNPVTEAAASGLGYLRDSFDSGNVLDVLSMGPVRRALEGDFTSRRPPTTHSGVGTLMMGRAPEELQAQAAGFSPFSEEPNYGNILDPRIKADREQGVMDLAFTGADVAGLAGLAGRGLRGGVRAAYPTLNPEVNMSRREFLGNTGKIAAGAAAASAVPDVFRGVDNLADNLAPSVARHATATAVRATPHEFFSAVNSADRIAKAHHNAVLAKVYDRELAAAVKEGRIDRSRGYETPYGNNSEVLEEISQKAYDEALNRSIEVRERLVNKLKEDPKYAQYESLEDVLSRVPEGGDFDAAVKGWREKHGVLETSEIKPYLESGGKYIDPQSGHEAVLNKYGDVEYRDVETGEQRRYAHWLPNKKGVPKDFPEEHGIFDEVQDPPKNFHDTYKKYMEFTPAEKMKMQKEVAHENMRQMFEDAQKYDYLDDFTVEELRQLRDELSGDEFKRGGSVTMPNNYRKGGRVRMI